MADQIKTLLRPEGDGAYGVTRFTKSQKKQTLEALQSLSECAADYDISDGDILLALSKGRNTFSAFGMFCFFWGNTMAWFGARITFVMSVISTILFMEWAVSKVEDILDTLAGWMRAIPIIGTFFDEQKENDTTIGKLGAVAVRNVLLGFLPPAVAGAATAIVAQVASSSSPAPSGPPTTSESEAGETALGKVMGMLSGEQPSDANLMDEEEVAVASDASGLSPNEVRSLINRIRPG